MLLLTSLKTYTHAVVFCYTGLYAPKGEPQIKHEPLYVKKEQRVAAAAGNARQAGGYSFAFGQYVSGVYTNRVVTSFNKQSAYYKLTKISTATVMLKTFTTQTTASAFIHAGSTGQQQYVGHRMVNAPGLVFKRANWNNNTFNVATIAHSATTVAGSRTYEAGGLRFAANYSGDILIVMHNDQQALEDLKSLILSEGVRLDYTRKKDTLFISLNWGNKTEGEKDSLLSTHTGIALLNDLINAKDKTGKHEVYQYSTADSLKVLRIDSSILVFVGDEPLKKEPIFTDAINNLSITPRNINGAACEPDKVKPRNGISGLVRICADGKFVQRSKGVITDVPRPSIVFHELYENFQRTHWKLPYETGGGKGAHQNAIEEEKRKEYPYGNKYPGTAFFLHNTEKAK